MNRLAAHTLTIALLAHLVSIVNVIAALLTCPDCGHQVSDRAKACPNCGCPVSAMGRPQAAQAQVQDASFASVRDSLIMVRTDRGNGSGFVVTMGNKKYILTNAHVLSAAKEITFTDIQGHRLIPTRLELARESDLARIEFRGPDLPALDFAVTRPNMNDPILVYGNSQGQDVVTQIAGKLIGVGPDKLEVDAGFVRGNSGSPVLDSAGNVLAVATYVVSTTPQQDWVVTGTRFEKIRRFGVRIKPDTEWTTIAFDDFRKQSALLEDLNTLLDDLVAVLPYWMEHLDGHSISDADKLHRLRDLIAAYDFDRSKNRYCNPEVCRVFSSFCTAYAAASKNAKRMADAKRDRPRAKEFRNVTYRRRFIEDTEEELAAMKERFLRLYGLPGSLASETRWASHWLTERAGAIRDFCRILERESKKAANGAKWEKRFTYPGF